MGDSSDDDVPLAVRVGKAALKSSSSRPQKAAASRPATNGPGPSDKPAPKKVKVKAEENGDAAPKGTAHKSNEPARHAESKPEKKKQKEPEHKGNAAKASEEAVKAKRERKVFDMPGQTRETPPEEDSLRKFYTSLREQRPDSAMAKKWMLQVGLLPLEEAEEEVAKAKNNKASPAKTSNRSRSGGSSGSGAATARKPAAARKPAQKPAPQNGVAKGKKRRKLEWSDEDEVSDASVHDSDEDDVPLAKRKKLVAAATAKKPPKPRAKKDVAFADGGLGSKEDAASDSDDDIPLAQRMKK